MGLPASGTCGRYKCLNREVKSYPKTVGNLKRTRLLFEGAILPNHFFRDIKIDICRKRHPIVLLVAGPGACPLFRKHWSKEMC